MSDEHPSDRLANAVASAVGDRVRGDASFAADVWGALVYNRWFDADGIEGMLTYRGADATLQDIRGDDQSFYLEGVEGPPPTEMQQAMARLGWTWQPES